MCTIEKKGLLSFKRTYFMIPKPSTVVDMEIVSL